jgi:hypothetical protein
VQGVERGEVVVDDAGEEVGGGGRGGCWGCHVRVTLAYIRYFTAAPVCFIYFVSYIFYKFPWSYDFDTAF